MRTGHFDKDCLYSTVKNVSGKSQVFGFLPPHGVRLADDQEYSVFGNVLEAVGRGDRATDRRHHQALADALDRGDLEIMKTPAPILTDRTTGANKIIKLQSGTLSAIDPCWRNSDSLDAVVAA